MICFYMDESVEGAITRALRERGVDGLTVVEDGREGITDVEVLTRASELARVVVTRDDDFLAEAAYRQRNHIEFCGVIYARKGRHPIPLAACIEDLELIAKLEEASEYINRVRYLPLS